jgi:peptide/nickel transport system substrate-binding protein
LKAHGWNVVPGGTDTCAKPGTAPGECGAGISAGEKLAFTILYASGIVQYRVELQALASSASQAGISIGQQQDSDNQVVSQALPCTKGSSCTWQVAYWYLSGWQYGMPINYPLATVTFGCGGQYAGGYCSPQLDSLMAKAETSNSLSSIYAYEDYLNKNVPVLWMPLQPYQISAVSSRLQGIDPQNNQDTVMPEFWSVSK